jgi:protein tyrosine phosphatase
MLGRYRPLDEDVRDARAREIVRIVSLAALSEIADKSPEYGRIVQDGSLPWPIEFFPVANYGTPADRESFSRFVTHVAGCLQAGERLLLHCGAGIGRTGMAATCVLIALGMSLEDAAAAVREAGSGPETEEQRDLVERFAGRKEPAR